MGWNTDGNWVVLAFGRRVWYVLNNKFCIENDDSELIDDRHISNIDRILKKYLNNLWIVNQDTTKAKGIIWKELYLKLLKWTVPLKKI